MIYQRQNGNVLVVTLVLLLVFTMLGLASIGDVSLNERIATNYRDKNVSFQAAEAALKEGEEKAFELAAIHQWENFQSSCTGDDCFTSTCNKGLCFNGSFDSSGDCITQSLSIELWEDPSTWTATDVAAVSTQSFSLLSEPPKYIIEFMCFIPADPDNNPNPTTSYPGVDWSYMYRITAYSVGEAGSSKVAVQSTFKVDPQ